MKSIPFQVKIICAALALCVGIGVAVALSLGFERTYLPQTYGGSLTVADRNSTTFGTPASPTLLTNNYVSSTAIRSLGLSNIVVAGNYLSKSDQSRLYIQVESSVDNGATYQTYDTITPQSDSVLVNTSGTSTSNGAPFVIPGNNLSGHASGTNTGFSFNVSAAGDYMRVAVKESATSTSGTVYMTLFAGNN